MLCSLLGSLWIGALAAPPAAAVLLAAGDGSGNTGAPPNDPGWANVGLRESLSCVYLGNRWVLTANHAGFGDVVLGGISYTAVTGSKFRLQNPDATNADLQMFKIVEPPPLPALVVGALPPPAGAHVTLIGNGRNRGPATSFEGIPGWQWGAGHSLRWGTNQVDGLDTVLGTEAFAMTFDEAGLADEAQAVVGDSGGAVFHRTAGGSELVGILYARGTFEGQPGQTSFFGNESYAADLSVYRAQIVAHTSLPGCADGLDDDLDGLGDWPADPGCLDAADVSEEFGCSDGIDGDGDGWIDFPEDPGCASARDHYEQPGSAPALGPAGSAAAAVLLGLAGRRALARRRAALSGRAP